MCPEKVIPLTDYDSAPLYNELVVCSNTLINTKHIFQTDSGWSPLVIRRGTVPRVWLSVKVNEQAGTSSFIDLIVDSKVINSSVKLNCTKYGFQILIDNQLIAEAGNHTSETLEVVELDLRPLGLNIYGDHKSLNIGNNSMSRNTSSNANAMFGIA